MKTIKAMELTLHIVMWKEGKLYVATVLEAGVTSQGKTKKEAIKNVLEALHLSL